MCSLIALTGHLHLFLQFTSYDEPDEDEAMKDDSKLTQLDTGFLCIDFSMPLFITK